MSMFHVEGRVVKLFHQQGQVNRDTGEMLEGKNKVQIIGEVPLTNGSSKFDLVTLTVPKGLDFKEYLEKVVSIPLGFFSPQKGNIVYFIPKGSKVSLVTS